MIALAEFDEDGPGGDPPALFAGGGFRFAGTLPVGRIARWDGSEWSLVGEFGASDVIDAMCVFDADGNGPEPPMLYVGGSFGFVGGPSNWIQANGLARWDGQQWSAVPGWAPAGGWVRGMTVWDDDGPGPNKPSLFITGSFSTVNGQPARGIVRWDGQNWFPLGQGLAGAGGGSARILVPFDDDGDGPNPGGLYVAGDFEVAGGHYTPGLARWGCPLTPPCLADCDFSTGFGVLDVFDFLCFANRFHAGAPYACDCDVSTGHNICDIFDFLCYGQRFHAGCP